MSFDSRFDNHVQLVFYLRLLKCSYFQQQDTCVISLVGEIICLSVWQECLLGVLRSKTVVYVTHQVEFLPTADLILVSIYCYSIVINLK
jgi:hypothetical protein